jgi:branched-chain amino acid transport system permease protein
MRTLGLLSAIVALAAAAAAPLFAGGYWLYLLSLMGVYGIVAVSLNILTGLSGQISLGHAGFVAIGAYGSAILAEKAGLSFLPATLIAVAIGWMVGLIVGFPAVRLRGLYLAIATLAFGISVERAIYHFKGLTGGPYGISVNPPLVFGYALNSSTKVYYLILSVVVLAIILVANIVNSRPGRMMIAMRDNPIAATAMGIDIRRLKVLTFAFSAAMSALGGALYAPVINFISVEHFTLWLSISFISMIVVGGLGSIAGSFLGATFVVIVPELLRGFGAYHQIIYGLAMIFVFVFWPKGLVGVLHGLAGALVGRARDRKPAPAPAL